MQTTRVKRTEEILKIVDKIVAAVAPEKIILFGSHAEERAGHHSDIDLLIIWDTQLDAAERMRCISRLIRPRPAPLDIVVKTPAEIRRSRQRVDPFLSEILEKGAVLYARPR